jgi:hypothetical protein
VRAKLKEPLYVALLLIVILVVLFPPWGTFENLPDDIGIPTAAAPADLNGPQLVERLRAQGICLHVFPVKCDTKDLDHGFYLAELPGARHSLVNLVRDPGFVDRWTGVVFVERRWPQESVQPALQRWGSCGLFAGRLVLFGDPKLLARIRAAVECGT